MMMEQMSGPGRSASALLPKRETQVMEGHCQACVQPHARCERHPRAGLADRYCCGTGLEAQSQEMLSAR